MAMCHFRYMLQYQESIPCEQLVMRLCDLKQSYTQFGGACLCEGDRPSAMMHEKLLLAFLPLLLLYSSFLPSSHSSLLLVSHPSSFSLLLLFSPSSSSPLPPTPLLFLVQGSVPLVCPSSTWDGILTMVSNSTRVTQAVTTEDGKPPASVATTR